MSQRKKVINEIVPFGSHTQSKKQKNPKPRTKQQQQQNQKKPPTPPSCSKCNEFEPNIYNMGEYIYQSNKAVVPPKFYFVLILDFWKSRKLCDLKQQGKRDIVGTPEICWEVRQEAYWGHKILLHSNRNWETIG